MAKVCTIAWVHGTVQGVGFRYSTQRDATELGEKLLDWLKAGGPRIARVEKVLSEPHQPERDYVNFGIRY